MLKPLTVWITKNCGKLFKRWEYQTTLSAGCKTCMQVKKQQLEQDMEQWTGSKMGKGYIKAVYCHPAYLTYTQSTSCEMLYCISTSWNQDWWGNINDLSYADDTTLKAKNKDEIKSLLMKVKEESEKVSLKLNIQKMKMASCPIILQQIDGETNGNRGRLYCLGLQNHCRWWLQLWN